jgi:hypothetical protein
MNCRPGDLAVIVRPVGRLHFVTDHLLGKIVRVTKLFGPESDPDPYWLYEGEPLPLPHGHIAIAIADKALRPLRDPGEDAKDETLTWLYRLKAIVQQEKAST